MKLSPEQLKQGYVQGHIYNKGESNFVSLELVYYSYCKKYNVKYSDMLNWEVENRDFESYKDAQKFYESIITKYKLKFKGCTL